MPFSNRPTRQYFFLLLRPDSILLGMGLALIAPHVRAHTIVAALALVGSTVVFFSLPNVYVIGGSTILLFPAAAIMCSALLWLTLNVPPLTKVLGSSALVYLGKRSFGLYVFHLAAFAFGNRYVLPWLPWASSDGRSSFYTQLLVTLAVTTVMAAISYRFFEAPFLRIKDKWATVLTRPV